MGRKHDKVKSWSDGFPKGTFSRIPDEVLKSQNYVALSAHAKELLLEFVYRYDGTNNGSISMTFEVAKERGIRGKERFLTALAELLHRGFIIKTRQGGRNMANYFALSWLNIQPGAHDERPTNVPPNTYRKSVDPFVPPKRQPRPARIPKPMASLHGIEGDRA